MNLSISRRNCLMVSALLLCACTGGGESGSGYNDVSVGTITGFGSVFVNGVEFDTVRTDVTLDGMPGSPNDLRIGMVVTVRGSIDANGTTGTAGSIVAEEVIKGPVDAIGADSIRVMQQTVLVNQLTRLENFAALSVLNASDTVAISGYARGTGVIVATRVEKIDPQSEYQLKGYISNVSASGFDIGPLAVLYPDADATLPNGTLVKVRGTYGNGQFTATRAEGDALEVSDADDMELQGFISALSGASDFVLGNVPVHFDANTAFESGVAAELAVGTQVEVSGSFLKGVLYAREIAFKEDVKLNSSVATVDISNRTLTVVDAPGIVITIDALTELKGDAESGFSTITAGGSVKVRGRMAGADTVVANELEWNAQYDGEVVYQASLDSTPSDQFSLNLLGMIIDTSTAADSVFAAEGTSENRMRFFTGLVAGSIVRLEALYNGGVLEWQSIGRDD